MFHTIKARLIIAITLLFVVFSTLFVLTFSNGNLGNESMQRIALLGEIRANVNGAMMEVRGYNIFLTQNFLDAYHDRIKKSVDFLDQLEKLVVRAETAKMIRQMKNDVIAWDSFNADGIAILKKYGTKINEAGFFDTEDGKKLGKIATESGVIIGKIS